jgi:hypothetical protein
MIDGSVRRASTAVRRDNSADSADPLIIGQNFTTSTSIHAKKSLTQLYRKPTFTSEHGTVPVVQYNKTGTSGFFANSGSEYYGRYRSAPTRPHTPPGYWNIGFGDSDNEKETEQSKDGSDVGDNDSGSKENVGE